MATFDPNAAAGAGSGIFGLPHTPDESAVVVLPVPFEATCSYGGGTANAPEAVVNASRQVDLWDAETGKPYEPGIAALHADPAVVAANTEARALAERIIERGGDVSGDATLERDLARVNALCEQMNAAVYGETERWLARGKRVVVLGGDHSTPFGSIRAHAEKYPGMGILHLDAHADLRPAFEGFTWSHASIMHNVMTRLPAVSRLVQVGIRDVCEQEWDMAQSSGGRIVLHHDAVLAAQLAEGQAWNVLCRRIVEPLPQQVYVSFDIDGLDPALCPHTGTPVPGGLSFNQASQLLRAVVRSGRTIVGVDLNEVAPGPDGDEWDANVGARMLYKLIGWMLRSHAPHAKG